MVISTEANLVERANANPVVSGDIIRDVADSLFAGRTLTTGHITNGNGGTVTQATSITTTVVLSTESGQITTFTSTAAAASETTFTVTNTLVGAQDCVVCSIATSAGAGSPMAFVSAVAAGSFAITITNLHAADAFDNVFVINFAILGGSAT